MPKAVFGFWYVIIDIIQEKLKYPMRYLKNG